MCLGFLSNKSSIKSLGDHFGSNLYQTEIDYLIEHEWASCAEDILWRRTKLGLFLTPEQTKQVELYVKDTMKLKTRNNTHTSLDKIAI
jgi:glycerol-3-phosphate dehydrogenase